MEGTADALIEELKRDADKGELLLWAAARGLAGDAEELVRTGADPATKDKHGRQAVHYAASNGHADILDYLSTKGVDLDAEDAVGRGALHYAAAGGHTDCVRVLLSKGCWRDAPDAADDAPLHLAARKGCLPAIKALVEAGAQLGVPNKRSLTPFAEAVLAGRTSAAEYLGALSPGGLGAALAASYRGVPLLHLAAGLGQAAAVEWLLTRPKGDRADVGRTGGGAGQSLTCLHAAALSGDDETVAALLRLGADPLAQTGDGRLPLELVPKAAPARAPPPPPPGALPPPPDDLVAAAAAAADLRRRTRRARRAFKALARAAAKAGGVDPEQALASRGVWGAAAAEADAAGAAAAAEAAAREEAEAAASPAAAFLRTFDGLMYEQQVAKVESYARMDEAALRELLPYLGVDALAAVAALRQALAMTELFGAVAALRGDDEFQSDIRDARVRDALEDVKRTNNLERYADQAAVMSVAAKFRRLHAITRKSGGLKLVIDDLRADLPGHGPEGTAAQAAELRAVQAACTVSAIKAVRGAATAALPPSSKAAARGGGGAKGSQGKGAAAAARAPRPATPAGEDGDADGAAEGDEEEDEEGEEEGEAEGDGGERSAEAEGEHQARLAKKALVDKLRAAATSAWVASAEGDPDKDIGYVDKFAKQFEDEVARAEGRHRWRLATYVGEEVANSLISTGKALALTLLAFAIMWLLRLMPHQQTSALLAKQAAAEAAAAKQAAVAAMQARLAALDDLEPPPSVPPVPQGQPPQRGGSAPQRGGSGGGGGGGQCPSRHG